MGSRISSSRLDSPNLSTDRLSPPAHHRRGHRHSLSPGSGAPRTRSLSQQHATGSSNESIPRRPNRQRTSGGGHGQYHHASTGHAVPSAAVLDRLISEIEIPDDRWFMQLMRSHRYSDSGEPGVRARPASVMDVENLLAAAGLEGSSRRSHRSRRSQGRQRTSASTSITNRDDDTEERLAAVRRQVLLSLAAASSSSPNRRRQWPDNLFLFTGLDQTCPYCKRLVPGDEFELHFTMCLTRPRVTYNEDTLQSDKGECSICLEDLKAGDKIARLPCLCIYHKHCIDDWFKRKQTCPEHPGD
nr:Zinc finger RING type [Hymenolepis microstoma]